MSDIDENWTTDPPEVGKRYFKTFWLDSPHSRFARVCVMQYPACIVDFALWNQPGTITEYRSILPIPDPVPPPLPNTKETK